METRIFDPQTIAHLVDRPNRFVIHCRLADGSLTTAHLANPGRLWEIMEPDSVLALEQGSSTAKLPWKAVAARYRDAWVPLVAARSNAAAAALVLPQLFPGQAIRSEARAGQHRFDFAIDSPQNHPLYIEVKSCSLIEEGTALFPDAPSLRATSHLRTLASLPAPAGERHRVLWLVWDKDATRFLPNPHTDPDFARTVLELRHTLDFQAGAMAVDATGMARAVGDVPLDWATLERLLAGGGSGFLAMHLAREVGGVKAGWQLWTLADSAEPGKALERLRQTIGRARPESIPPSLPACFHPWIGAIDQTIAYPVVGPPGLAHQLQRGLEALPLQASLPGLPHRYRPFLDLLNHWRHDPDSGSSTGTKPPNVS